MNANDPYSFIVEICHVSFLKGPITSPPLWRRVHKHVFHTPTEELAVSTSDDQPRLMEFEHCTDNQTVFDDEIEDVDY
ncbi:hypothetical protein O6P43_013420 [Quillaja saponaria]|uniref:Uncharacterized protein n=1 Tax=Quillaja saponaria TaxID=32244 RepID=A0AAD7M5J7_QUISA|nr:hypothetical protein O6P43_013420 [Quillaja saponaria]